MTILRAVHKYKDSREQFEQRTHKRLIAVSYTHLQELIRSFQIDAKIVLRKKSYVVYVKEGAQIVDILAVMEANVALMNLENIRILKEMRNSVNRKVNCETANINKTVSAAVKQIEDIRLIAVSYTHLDVYKRQG